MMMICPSTPARAPAPPAIVNSYLDLHSFRAMCNDSFHGSTMLSTRPAECISYAKRAVCLLVHFVQHPPRHPATLCISDSTECSVHTLVSYMSPAAIRTCTICIPKLFAGAPQTWIGPCAPPGTPKQHHSRQAPDSKDPGPSSAGAAD